MCAMSEVDDTMIEEPVEWPLSRPNSPSVSRSASPTSDIPPLNLDADDSEGLLIG